EKTPFELGVCAQKKRLHEPLYSSFMKLIPKQQIPVGLPITGLKARKTIRRQEISETPVLGLLNAIKTPLLKAPLQKPQLQPHQQTPQQAALIRNHAWVIE
ncbi:hypothetical protein ACVGW2_07425, partial [Enterobacter intestinihominis]